jgi:hypothetical protein
VEEIRKLWEKFGDRLKSWDKRIRGEIKVYDVRRGRAVSQ